MDSKPTFRLDIKPHFFVPNISDRFNDNRRVHFIGYGKCNYRCDFCSFSTWKTDYPEYSLETFEHKLWEMLPYSKSFKFTGGEPTLNPHLRDIMSIAKIYGAQNFLDTNGSNPRKVKELLEAGLVDIVGISLKGLNAQEAADTARIKNSKLCWDNVWETIDIISKYENVNLIITFVACEGYFKESDLDTLAKLLAPYPRITLKINNCYTEDYIKNNRKGLDKSEIYAMVERFVERYPEYKGRTVLFREHECCFNTEKIALF